MQKWDYYVITQTVLDNESTQLSDMLAELGRQGWKLVPIQLKGFKSVTGDDEAEDCIVMEREKEEEPQREIKGSGFHL